LGAAIPPLFLCVVGAAICCRCGYMLWVRLYGKGEAVAPPFLRESQQVTLGAALSTADYNIKITPPLSEEVADMPQGRGTNHWAYQRLTHYIPAIDTLYYCLIYRPIYSIQVRLSSRIFRAAILCFGSSTPARGSQGVSRRPALAGI